MKGDFCDDRGAICVRCDRMVLEGGEGGMGSIGGAGRRMLGTRRRRLTRALDVHEEGAGAGHKGLAGDVRDATQGGDSGVLVGLYLQLVLAGLVLRAGVEKVDGENL